jgi:glycosyltransferase A (GT-A) superfamily protein (DUF2064 family)
VGYSGAVRSEEKDTADTPGQRFCATGVFAKRPEVGCVKTRLEPLLGPLLGSSGPTDLARALLQDAAKRLSAPDLGLELVFAPDEARAWFEDMFPDHVLRAQVGLGLGARMANWFGELLGGTQPRATAVAVGADSPWTSGDRVRRAHALLRDGADVVLGPDYGGGYYLVGLREPRVGLFTEVEMSTEGMFEATCDWIRSRGLRLELLDVDYDLDVPGDWHRFVADLEQPREVKCAADWPSYLAAFAERVRLAGSEGA